MESNMNKNSASTSSKISVWTENLSRSFGNFKAVDNISLSVARGEIFGLLGPNGAGKSTTIKMLCGLLQPSSGQGEVDGLNILDQQEEIKKHIGYMSQRFSLYDDLTIEENMNFFGSIYGLSKNRLQDRKKIMIAALELEGKKDLLVKKLPGGIKQRLALATALLHDPSIIFLDEPTSGVDPLMRRNFWQQIYSLAEQGKTIFITTHYMDEAEHCNRAALIIAGQVLAIDSPSGLRDGMQNKVYELQSERYLEIFETLKNRNYIEEISLFGRDIHIILSSGQDLPKDFAEELRQKGFDDIHTRPISPSLEDVFVIEANKAGKSNRAS